MAQIIVQIIENAVKARLQRRARRNGRGLEDETRDILCRAAQEKAPPAGGLGREIAGLFAKIGLESEIPELRS
ncbi:MAG: hypothetical protein WCA13_15600 [Terriglobales bacterium]